MEGVTGPEQLIFDCALMFVPETNKSSSSTPTIKETYNRSGELWNPGAINISGQQEPWGQRMTSTQLRSRSNLLKRSRIDLPYQLLPVGCVQQHVSGHQIAGSLPGPCVGLAADGDCGCRVKINEEEKACFVPGFGDRSCARQAFFKCGICGTGRQTCYCHPRHF